MKRSLAPALVILLAVSSAAFAVDGGVTESRGYYLTKATTNRTGTTPHGALAPLQTFELVRPGMDAFRIGRIYTSCPCVELSSPKKSFSRGERAIFELKNVKPTPIQGHTYAIYVQVTGPVRATLRFDTFVKTGAAAPVKAEEKKEPEGDDAVEQLDEIADEAEKEAEKALAIAAENARKSYAEKEGDDPYRAVSAVDDFGRDGTVGGSDPMIDDKGAVVPDEEEPAKTETDEVDEVEEAEEADAEEKPEAAKPSAPATEASKPSVPATDDLFLDSEVLPPYAVDQRVNLIALGVADLDRARKFYEELGWKAITNDRNKDVVYFQLNGQILAVHLLKNLLADQNRTGAVSAPGGIALGIVVRNRDDVEKTYRALLKAGGISLKEPDRTTWGATAAYVADPDGYPWHIAWTPLMAVNENDELWIK